MGGGGGGQVQSGNPGGRGGKIRCSSGGACRVFFF